MTRGRTIRLLLVVPLLAAGIAMGAVRPASAAVVCNTGSHGDPLTGVIKESIVVPANADCVLVGATVRGGVTVGAGAYFSADNSEIRGSVTGAGVSQVVIAYGVVRGSVTFTDATDLVEVFQTEVRGDVSITGSQQAALGRSTVRGSATLNNNGRVVVGFATVGANLTCAGNGPTSTYNPETNTAGGANNCPAV